MKKSRLESLAILAALALGWKRLDLKPGPPKTETGYLTFDEFLAQVCPACSQLDYQDWLKEQ